jgi:acyl-CoA synthetase (AMP-forming)/AMP-acid ligase II
MPLGSTGGLGHFHANLFLGNPVILLPYFFGAMDDYDIRHMLDTVEREKITGFLSTPGMLTRLAENHRDLFRSKCRRVRYLLANVTPMREALVRDLMQLLPETRFYTYYGLTEASRSVHHCYNDNPEKMTSAGRPSPGVEIAIGDANTEGVGEVLIKGPNVMDGYWEMGDQGFNADGWFCSGDLGRIDDDGFLTIHGRLKENIRVDGLDCLPREMEEVLLEHPEVADCAVVGLPDPKTHQRVAAAIVPAPGADHAGLPDKLCFHCSERLEFYKAPTRYGLVDAIPKTDLGKIKRDEVSRQLGGMALTVIGE